AGRRARGVRLAAERGALHRPRGRALPEHLCRDPGRSPDPARIEGRKGGPGARREHLRYHDHGRDGLRLLPWYCFPGNQSHPVAALVNRARLCPARSLGDAAPMRIVDLDEAVGVLKNGDRVYIHGGSATPHVLIDGMVALREDLRNVEVVHMHTNGPAPYAEPEMEG